MAISFPTSPANGQTYQVNDRIWQYATSIGWRRVINAGQVVSVFVAAGPFVDTLAAFPNPISGSWTLLTYI